MGEVAWLGGEEKDGTEEEGIFVAKMDGRESEVFKEILADLKNHSIMESGLHSEGHDTNFVFFSRIYSDPHNPEQAAHAIGLG